MSEIRITVIGAGYMGAKHARAVSEHPFLALDSVVDYDKKHAEKIAEKYNIDKALTEYEPALEEADGAIIATPAFAHLEQTHAAFDHEVPFLLEKPVVDTLDMKTARELVKREKKSNIATGVSFIRRYRPEYAKAREKRSKGNLGDLISVRAVNGGTEATSRRTKGRIHPVHRVTIHDIDMINWCVDNPIERVFSVERRKVLSDVDIPDATQTVLYFQDDLIGMIENYHILPNLKETFNLIGENGTISVNTPNNSLVVDQAERTHLDNPYWPIINGQIRGSIKTQLDWFAKAIINEEPMLADIEDGIKAQAVADAIVTSLNENTPVPVEYP